MNAEGRLVLRKLIVSEAVSVEVFKPDELYEIGKDLETLYLASGPNLYLSSAEAVVAFKAFVRRLAHSTDGCTPAIEERIMECFDLVDYRLTDAYDTTLQEINDRDAEQTKLERSTVVFDTPLTANGVIKIKKYFNENRAQFAEDVAIENDFAEMKIDAAPAPRIAPRVLDEDDQDDE